jgi:hypothetical protein
MLITTTKINDLLESNEINPIVLFLEKISKITDKNPLYIGFYIQIKRKGYLTAEKLFVSRLERLIKIFDKICHLELEIKYLNVIKKFKMDLVTSPNFRDEKFIAKCNKKLLKKSNQILKSVIQRIKNDSNISNAEDFNLLQKEIFSNLYTLNPYNYVTCYLTHLFCLNNNEFKQIIENNDKLKKVRNLKDISRLVKFISSIELRKIENNNLMNYRYLILESNTDSNTKETVCHEGVYYSSKAGFGVREYWVLKNGSWIIEDTFEEWRK